jgi:preprotein translocase subunit YajC
MKKFMILMQLALLPAFLFAQEADAPPRDQGIFQTLVMIGIAMVFFYFILWRPEQKRRKMLEQWVLSEQFIKYRIKLSY